jgi:hypothetical protein
VISRSLQWLATLVVAIVGFVYGVNQAGPAVYKTDVGKVSITIKADRPGNLFVVSVPQAKYVARFHPYNAPLVWRARTVTLTPAGHRALEQDGKLGLARIVLDGQSAVVRSAARSFAFGAAGAVIAAVTLALVFTAIFGGLVTRLLIALFAVAPLLTAGVIAYVISTRGITP